MNIYVGNLPHETTEDQLKQTFEAFGEVASVNLVKDKHTGESRGFGFVQMPNQDEGKAAIAGMNGNDSLGRELKVEEGKPRPASGGFGGGEGGGRGRHGGGGFGNRGGGRGGRGGGGGGGRRRY